MYKPKVGSYKLVVAVVGGSLTTCSNHTKGIQMVYRSACVGYVSPHPTMMLITCSRHFPFDIGSSLVALDFVLTALQKCITSSGIWQFTVRGWKRRCRVASPLRKWAGGETTIATLQRLTLITHHFLNLLRNNLPCMLKSLLSAAKTSNSSVERH